MRRYPLAIVMIPLLAAGCSASPAPDDPPSTEPEGAGTVESSCTDSTSPDQMGKVTASATLDGLQLDWATPGTQSAGDTVLWSANVQTADFASAYQVGVKRTGAETSFFVFDLNGAEQENLDGAEISADGASGFVPWDSLPGLADSDFEWRAVLSIDGVDVAMCPQPGDDPLVPNKLTVDR